MYTYTKTLEEALKERAAIESEMLYALVSTEHLTSCQEIVLAGPKSRRKMLVCALEAAVWAESRRDTGK